MRICPYCERTLETPLVCTGCESLIPMKSDPNPFEVFGLTPAWGVSTKDLKMRFLRFSRHLHPDYFATAGEEECALAESASATMNFSYELVEDPVRRADWLVRHLGGPSDGEERQMPQAFLIEVLDWNEALEEARTSPPGSPKREALSELASTLRGERNQRISDIGRLLQPLPEKGSPALVEARRQLNAVRYVDRVLGDLERLRLESAALEGGATS
jgi:molecular chaperone HscB